MAYKDRTYCTGVNCRQKDTCPSAVNEEVKQNAERSGLYLSVVAAYDHDCFVVEEPKEITYDK